MLKYIQKLTPNKLQALGLSVFSRTYGARGKVLQKDLIGNTTWLQRATIALINENERFSPVAG
ncbi:MAG: hypothetical protein VX777_03815 [Chlamydiota bacterium]|nr:hypothetical protein [Chlamydiota bacterium]